MMRLAAICAALLDAGMRPDMPAAVIEQGTLPAQREIMATLTTLASRATAEKIRSPAIIVIGDVVALAHSQRSEAPAMERAA
jgi:siroheme synthase